MIWRRSPHDNVMQQLKPLYPRLWRYCLVLTGNRSRADDLAQSACVRVLEKSSQLGQDDKLDGWIFRIAQRIWLNELRSEAVRRGGGLAAIEDIDIPDHRPDPESNLLAREVLSEVMALPEAQRATVVLVYVEGYSYKEAAEILGIPVGTVMSRLAGARGKLSDRFEHKKSSTG